MKNLMPIVSQFPMKKKKKFVLILYMQLCNNILNKTMKMNEAMCVISLTICQVFWRNYCE